MIKYINERLLCISITIKQFIIEQQISINKSNYKKSDCGYKRISIASRVDKLTEKLNTL
tara:strand:- start:247 stop:423 length:177 start_codon:yes stop_codon:yes gene_type:complete